VPGVTVGSKYLAVFQFQIDLEIDGSLVHNAFQFWIITRLMTNFSHGNPIPMNLDTDRVGSEVGHDAIVLCEQRRANSENIHGYAKLLEAADLLRVEASSSDNIHLPAVFLWAVHADLKFVLLSFPFVPHVFTIGII
jgi:hypothetical protein